MLGLTAIPWKFIGGVLVAVFLAGLIADRGRWMQRAHGDEATLNAYCADVRQAAGNPKLDCKQAPQQILDLGKSLAALQSRLAVQNGAVQALGDQTKSDQANTAQASKAAEPAAQKAASVSVKLDISSHSPAVQQAPCEPSAALKGAWQ